MVPAPGIEPGRLTAAVLKTAADTNFATLATGAGCWIQTNCLRITNPLHFPMC